MNIIYLNCGKYELDGKKIIAVIDTTFAVVKRKPEKKIRLVRDSNQIIVYRLLDRLLITY